MGACRGGECTHHAGPSHLSQSACWKLQQIALWLCLLLASRAAPLRAAEQLFKYGDDPRMAEHHTGAHWNYKNAGLDWNDSEPDGTAWSCLTGKQQSPVDLRSMPAAAASSPQLEQQQGTRFLGFQPLTSTGSNVLLENNGHTMKLSWRGASVQPRLGIQLPRPGKLLVDSLQLQPGQQAQEVVAAIEQVHFHTHSEHSLDGRFFPLEAHFVARADAAALPACGPSGCFVVAAVLWELAAPGDDGSTAPAAAAAAASGSSLALKALWSALPTVEGDSTSLPPNAVVDFAQLLPSNRSYLTYAGSLTTPPCTENVLWLVMLQPLQLSRAQLEAFLRVVGDSSCRLNTTGGSAPLNGSASQSIPATASSSSSNLPRHLLQSQPQGSGSSSSSTAKRGTWSCTKLGAGQNYRLTQPLHGRQVRRWRDGPRVPQQQQQQQQAATGMGPVALAALVLGVAVAGGIAGAGLLLLHGALKRRKQRWLLLDGEELALRGSEMETAWLRSVTPPS